MKTKQALILALTSVALLTSCSSEDSQAELTTAADSQAPLEAKAIEVEFAPVRVVQAPREIVTTGTLMAYETVTVSAEVNGTVRRIHYDIGDFVRHGALLLELDKEELQLEVERARAALQEALARVGAEDAASLPRVEDTAAVRQAQALLEEARRQSTRARELLARGVISQAQLDEILTNNEVAETRHQSAIESVRNQLASIRSFEASLELAEKKVRDAGVRSPISGYVSERLASQGEFLRENAAVFTLVESQNLKLVAEIPEREAAEVHQGVPVLFTVDAFAGREFGARIERISPIVDRESRTFQVEARVENPALRDGTAEGYRLKPGFFARVRVMGSEQAVLLIPEEALYSLAGVEKVFVREHHRVAERAVQTAGFRDGMLEVASGVDAHEMVAVTRLADLSDGQLVIDPRD
ncbi:MAG: efflux RND transporter periplasmic adaptor subunit [Acidobacteriota bacterium]